MGRFEFWFLFILLISITTGEWNSKDFMKREHSLIKPYHGSGIGIPYWDFFGNVMVTSSHIRLTPDQQSRQGAIWNSIPVKSRNWELQVQFKVFGKGKDLFGDGFAIWYAKERMQSGPVFGSKDFFSGLVIFLDTYSNHNGPHNHQHPYVSAMVNNGTLSYDHDRDGTHTMLGGCETKFRNLDHDTYISIRYENDVLVISLDVENKMSYKHCLTVQGVKLPTNYYFGLTASTGDLSDNHDIISVKMYELDAKADSQKEDRSHIAPSASFFEPPRDHKDDPEPSRMSGIKIFFLGVFGVLGVIACIVIGVMIYQKQQENSRKRFY